MMLRIISALQTKMLRYTVQNYRTDLRKNSPRRSREVKLMKMKIETTLKVR